MGNHTYKTSNAAGGEKRDTAQVQVISRSASILRAVRDMEGLNVSQLARAVRLPRTTVYRIVATLEAEGLLTTTPSGEIELGLDLVSLGAAVKGNLRRELRPFLEELSVRVDETVDLAIFKKNNLVFLDQVARPRRLTAVSGIGITFPLHCTANGKAILAILPPDEVEQIIPEKLEIFTPATIRTRSDLFQELGQVRLEGVAYDREEHTQGICAVGATIPGLRDPLAAISIPVPSIRFYGEEKKFVEALLQTCDALNQRFSSYGFMLGSRSYEEMRGTDDQ
jgi:DNA-binding IclR family transcriptional regulator